ncbi:hypothetical protein [Streptomyces sp. R44]|uniref:Uncharacterized protein n=1 Tax=Streptomyces sp. R44 TaxID=3238633 RepID=A0AB39T8E2_9ACTN
MEHAVGERGTLCGKAARHTSRFLHLFVPEAVQSCRPCRRAAEVAPTRPCAQERLHDRVQAAAEGRTRDDLLSALRKGAEIRLWINGPSADLAKSYARLDELTHGSEPAAEAFLSAETIGMADVEDGHERFLVVLPTDGGRPVVARGPRDLPRA